MIIDDRRNFCFAVWEITTRCNLACAHCGSRAGASGRDELTTQEALGVVGQLREVGIRQVTLLGGEAFLRKDWSVIARAIRDAGMRCTMTTGAWGLTPRMARNIRESGIDHVAISIDGLDETHDQLRGRRSSWHQCITAVSHLRNEGIRVGCVTQINRLSAPELPALYDHLAQAGISSWQTQLTAPMGRAADNAEFLFQPSEILELFPVLARIARRAWSDGIRFIASSNIGYYGPYERMLRSNGHPWGFWRGPAEGLRMIGIEADGAVKADLTLPSIPYAGGNVRERRLVDIVRDADELTFNLHAGTPDDKSALWGFCKTCAFARLCRGGDTFTAHVFFGRRGNHPYCYHRAQVNARRGKRERLVLVQAASGKPYDYGRFAIVEEAADAPWDDDPLHFTGDCVVWPESWPEDEDAGLLSWSEAHEPEWALAIAFDRTDATVLPRPAYDDELVFLRDVLEAKTLLDRAESSHAEPRLARGIAKPIGIRSQEIEVVTCR